MVRRITFSVLGALVLFFVVLVASFFLVPKERLNALIAKQLSEAFGHGVTVSGRPSVSLFPYLSVSFGPLKVAASDPNSAPLMEIERASGRLSVTSLWEGNPSLRFIALERANMSLVRSKGGQSNWSTARLFAQNWDGPSNKPALRFPIRLRSISFSDSTLIINDEKFNEPEIFTGINATIVGPPRSDSFSAAGTLIWRGELAKFSADLEDPGVMMVGAKTKASVMVDSALLSARFNGDLIWQDKLQGDGSLEADIPSIAKLGEWLGLKGVRALPSEQVRILGDGTFTSEAFDFRPISVRLGDGKADGRLKISKAGHAIGLSGTLAFDQIALSEVALGANERDTLLDDLFDVSRSNASLDLRVSAENALIGAQEARNIALGLLLKDDNLIVNIGAVELAGANNVINGKLGGELTIKNAHQSTQLETNLTLSETSFQSLSETFGVTLPFEGPLSLTVEMKTEGNKETEIESAFNAKVSAKLAQGLVKEMAFDEISDLAAADNSALNGIDKRTTYDIGEIQAVVRSDGIMDISKFYLKNQANEFVSSGMIDLVGNSVSLLGAMKKAGTQNAEEEGAAAVPFTLGGTISKPRITSANGKAL